LWAEGLVTLATSSSFQPTTAPGREGPAPAQPIEGQPAQPGGQEAPPAPFGGSSFTFLILALPLLLIFMMTRSQTKKQKQLESSLKTGDHVITQSGLLGKIIEISDRSTRVKLEIAPGVTVKVLKSSIQGVDGGDTPADAKPGDTKAGEKSKEPAAKDKPQEKKA
jgi:preprotein translocase subunit YajC